jgi:hypothetical protein
VPEEVLELDQHRSGNDPCFARLRDQARTRFMVIVARLDRRDQHARV